MKSGSKNVSADMINAEDTAIFAELCKALGHPARVMIINYLKRIDRCLCGDIVELLPLAQSTVSQHLKCLKKAGLIKGEVEGPKTCYCLDRTMLKRFTRMAKTLDRSGRIVGGIKK
jgi:DNA-binding transcriptional ArsR family regulator